MNKRQTLAKRCAKLEKENAKLKKIIYGMHIADLAIECAKRFSNTFKSDQITIEETNEAIKILEH